MGFLRRRRSQRLQPGSNAIYTGTPSQVSNSQSLDKQRCSQPTPLVGVDLPASITEDRNSPRVQSSTDVLYSDVSFLSDESLLSDYGSDAEETIDSCLCGLERMEKRFEQREKLFNTLFRGKEKSVAARILKANEDRSRVVSIKMYKSLQDSSRKEVSDHVERSSRDLNLFETLWGSVLFECFYTTEGTFSAIIYCTTHYTFYLFLDEVLLVIAKKSQISEVVFYSLVMAFSIILMRINGYLWTWLSEHSYKVVKFEMHNREILQYHDAWLMGVLKGSLTSKVVNTVSFYGLYIGIVHLYTLARNELIYAPLVAWYKQMEEQIQVWLNTKGLEYTSCDQMEEFLGPYRFIVDYICRDKEWLVLDCGFNAVLVLMLALGMHMFGQNFLDGCT